MAVADKVVIITGGAMGIGRYNARLFAAAGAKLAIADVASMENVASEVAELGGQMLPVHADIRDEEQVPGPDGARPRPLRPHRRADQRRRHRDPLPGGLHAVAPHPRHGIEFLRKRDADQPHWDLPLHQARNPLYGRAGLRPHHQLRPGQREQRPDVRLARRLRLPRLESVHPRLHLGGGGGGARAQHLHREPRPGRRRPRHPRDAAASRPTKRPSRTATK